jgi:hypothetical protein
VICPADHGIGNHDIVDHRDRGIAVGRVAVDRVHKGITIGQNAVGPVETGPLYVVKAAVDLHLCLTACRVGMAGVAS